MSIPSSQLQTWTNYESAAITGARDTHRHIRDNLEDSNSRLQDRDIEFDTLLQGSYANETIIRDSSDVDILVRLCDPFHVSKRKLDDSERDSLERDYTSSPPYSYSDFQDDVLDELRDVYGHSAVDQGEKAIVVETSTLPLPADVVPVQEYRFYRQYSGYNNERDYIEGIVFWSQSGTKIINYPEQHMENAAQKHQQTNNRHKPTVRIFKNARNRMDEEGIFSKDDAPSYSIECLLWNVPNSVIDTNDLRTRYVDVVNHLRDDDFDDYRQQHNLLNLFGSGNTKWSKSDANEFVDGLAELWEN